MSTHVSKKVVPSSPTPNMAVNPAGSGTEVSGPVPGIPVPAAGTPVAASPDLGAAAAFDAFLSALQPMVIALSEHLRQPVVGVQIKTARASHEVAVPLVANLLHDHPGLAPGVQPAVLVSGVDTLHASRRLAQVLVQVTHQVLDTGRMAFDSSWLPSQAVIATATVQAKRNKSMAVALAPVRDALRRAPRTVASGNATEAARQRMAAADTRAATARQHAATVGGAAVRTQAAHAARHPPPASPVPLANPQGPAASADVAPQGPAPGR